MKSSGFGYFSSSPFWYSTYLPQRIQNLIIRDYASSQGITLRWSLPEMSYSQSLYTFHQLLEDCCSNSCDHIISTSVLMHSSANTDEIISLCQARGIAFHFAIERISVLPDDDISSVLISLNATKLASSWASTLSH